MIKRILKWFFLFMILCALGAGIITGVVIYYSFDLPKISSLADYHPPVASKILAKDGTVLATIGLEDRDVATINEIPPLIINAFLSAEDSGFYEHNGVDYLGLIRALLKNIQAGRVVQGGSTITQQVAKSLLLNRERSFARKVKDFLLALNIEKKFSKEEILFLYLNQVYLGSGHYGVKAAFRGHFGKELNEATIAEAAMIAGLLVAPGRYSPHINPEFARKRQVYVLKRMLENNKITPQEYQSALDEPVRYKLIKKDGFLAPYFTDWVRQRIIEQVGETALKTEGLEIQTTLDWQLQQQAEKFLWQGVLELDKRQGYLGPINHLNAGADKFLDYEINFRRELYLEKSTYFTINQVDQRVNEYHFDENQYREARKSKLQQQSIIQFKSIMGGNNPVDLEQDPLLSLLEKNKMYPAVVIKTDNVGKIIYVNLGGMMGIIPSEYFRWAYKRSLSEEMSNAYQVKSPSSILHPGDVVLVNMIEKKVPLFNHLDREFKDANKANLELITATKNNFFLLCALEQYPEVQGAIVALNPDSGDIATMVGGTDFTKSQFNRVIQSARQPGSAIKPFLYATALENGFTPSSILIDSPEALGGVDSELSWKPRNYDGDFLGPITFRTSLEKSRNVTTIKMAEEIGVNKILDFLQRIGLKAEIAPDLSLALGSFGVNLLNFVATYAIFPNGGKKITPKAIVSAQGPDGKILFSDTTEVMADNAPPPPLPSTSPTPEPTAPTVATNPFWEKLTSTQVYDPRLAYMMTYLLRGVVQYGTATSARRISSLISGKTGTTNQYVDALFIGFSRNLVTGVWVGFDNNQTLGFGETGARAALPIWTNFMEAALAKSGEKDFSIPEGLVHVKINKETGKPDREGGTNAFTEVFVEGTEPGAQEANRIDPTTTPVPVSPDTILEEDDYFHLE